MKKFIYSLILYIGMCASIFNPVLAHAQINIPLPFQEELNHADNLKEKKSIIETKNEFIKLITVFFITDKLYPNEEIHRDITGFLHRVWPNTKPERLKKVSQYLKSLIILKRRYTYAINHMKQKIKASTIVIADAPIVAKDGEFAPKFSNKRKAIESNDYKVNYTPYKYLGYDQGKDGEAVRLRDKNYEPLNTSIVDELTLALLKFDISAFYRALRKFPSLNDGSREKMVELEGNISSRLVMDTITLGSKETVNGFIEVRLPQGVYINGDFINPRVKPQFIIDESAKTESNIKEYQIFYPQAYGVENNHETSRILIGSVKFPLKISRLDKEKDINIKSTFTFYVCQARTKNCKPITSHNSLTINADVDTRFSIHKNAVQIAFARLPAEKSKHASVKEAYYNPTNKLLTVKFKTNKHFSNVSAMAEDASETNFINPRYNIEEDEITATFHTKLSSASDTLQTEKNIENGSEIAISAAFDNDESLRTVVTPQIIASPQLLNPPYITSFLFALILNFMPGMFYLLQCLIVLFMLHPDKRTILYRYGIGTFIGILLLSIYNKTHIWSQIYENPWIISSAVLLATSYLMDSFDYMDFELFRPLRGKIKRGFFIGLFTILLASVFPLPLKQTLFNEMSELPLKEYMFCWIIIWLGINLVPLIFFIFRRKFNTLPLKMHGINKALTLLYLMTLIFIIFQTRHIGACLILGFFALMIAFIWYIYPKAVAAAISHKRNTKNKREVFSVVQKHAFIITTFIWLCCTITLNQTQLKNPEVPDVKTITEEANVLINEDKSLLFILNTAWSPVSWLNRLHLNNIRQPELTIRQYTPAAINRNAAQWYKKYQKTDAPLHILFTKRHPQGISLPANLKSIDWQEATAYFIPQPEKEKEPKQ